MVNGTQSDKAAPLAKGSKVGVLLINLGTPDAPEPEAVGRYLRQFLMDGRVIDIPYPLRWFLVNAVIVPKRKFESAEKYEEVWTEKGSPLLMHLSDLRQEVAARFDGGPGSFHVAMAMRYGNPSIRKGLEELRDARVGRIIALALYPQYAESTTLSSKEALDAACRDLNLDIPVHFVPAFHDDPGYIGASSEAIHEVMIKEKPEHLVMSFHGVPERHVRRTDRSPTGQSHCLASPDCCVRMTEANRDCYRAQCFATAREIARALGLKKEDYTVSFQSRLGRAAWIAPSTEDVLADLGHRRIKKLAVACPSFVADCLETLEEIALRGAEDFKKAGGGEYVTIECLNSRPSWVNAVVSLIEAHARMFKVSQKDLGPSSDSPRSVI